MLAGLLLTATACKKEAPAPPLEGKWQYQGSTEFTYSKQGAFLTQNPSWQSMHSVRIGAGMFDFVSVDNIVTLHLTYTREGNTLHLLPLYPSGNEGLITKLTDHSLVLRFNTVYANPTTEARTDVENRYIR